jgi:hypothetical protein
MVNLEPIENLLHAQQAMQYNDPAAREESLKAVSKAIGSDKPLPLLRERLDKVFDDSHPIHNAVLRLAIVETRKK